jgi:hypothetical protein
MNHKKNHTPVIRRDRQVILVGKINGAAKLLASARHNLREIRVELGEDSQINSAKSVLNIVIRGGKSSSEVAILAQQLISTAGVKKLRKDAVYAVEYIFSLPPGTAVDPHAYFEESIEWLAEYTGCPVLSAVTHLDESAPHVHVLVLPLVGNKMNGSALVGYKSQLSALKQSHYEKVASRFGVARAVPWTKKQRHYIAEQAYSLIKDQPQLLAKPDLRYALTQAIIKDPGAVQVALSITPPVVVKKLKTLAQIFTSKGKGSSQRESSQ